MVQSFVGDFLFSHFQHPYKPPFLFAFTWINQQYTWTVMPQGFTEVPYLSQVLHERFKHLRFPGKLTLLQYVDDIFLC